jgi:hypothetical protein
VVARLGEIVDGRAASIDHRALRTGAMKEDLSHVPPPVVKRSAGFVDSSAERCGTFGWIP